MESLSSSEGHGNRNITHADTRAALADTSTSGSDNFSYLLRPEDEQPATTTAPTPSVAAPTQATERTLSRQATLISVSSTAVATPTPTRRHPPRPPVPHRHTHVPMSMDTKATPNEAAVSPSAIMVPEDPFADTPTSPSASIAPQPDLICQLRELVASTGNSELLAAKLAEITATASTLPTPLSPPPTATEMTHGNTSQSPWHARPVPPPLRLGRSSQVPAAMTPPNTATSPRSWSSRPKYQTSSNTSHQMGESELALPHHPPPPVPPSPASTAVNRQSREWLGGPPPVTPARQMEASAYPAAPPVNAVSAYFTFGVPYNKNDLSSVQPTAGPSDAPMSPDSAPSSLSSASDAATAVHAPEGDTKSHSAIELRRVSSVAALREQQVKRYTAKLEKDKKDLLNHIHEMTSTAQSLSTLLSHAHTQNDGLVRKLEEHEVALKSAQRTLGKRDREIRQLTAQLKSTQAELTSVAARLDSTTHMLNEVQIMAHQQVQTVSEDRDRQVERLACEMHEVGERWKEKVSEAQGKLACKDAVLAVVQAQRREVVELWSEVGKVVVGMVKSCGMALEIAEADVAGAGKDGGEEDLSGLVRSGTSVTQWLTRACGQMASAYQDVCGQLRDVTEATNARQGRIMDLEAELKDVYSQLTAVRTELDTLQASDSQMTQALRTELASVSADRDSLHTDLTTLRHQLAATANERDQYSTDLARLQTELTDAKSNHARTAGDLAMAKKLLEAERKYRKDHSAVQAELADVQSQLAQVQAERAADQQQLTDEQSRRKAETGQLMAAVVEAQREVAQLREKLALVQGGADTAGLARSASRPASPIVTLNKSVPSTPLLPGGTKAVFTGELGISDGAGYGLASPADSLSTTIARLQQRLNRSGNGELGSATSSPSSRVAGI